MDYKYHLVNELLPYWLSVTPDRECGGVFTYFDENGAVSSTDKQIWFQGRAMWVYAMTYRLVEQRQEYLDICEHIFRFFDKCELPDGALPFITDQNGNAKQVRERYYYSEAFAVMGLAQYYRVCGKEAVWQKAEHYFDILFEKYKVCKQYRQTVHTPIPTKTFGLHMAMLATAQFMRNAGRDPEKYDALACMAIDEMMHGGYVDDVQKAVVEYVGLDGERIDQPFAYHSCPGHVYEAAWFVLCEGEVKNEDALRAFGKKLCDYAMPEGFQKKTLLIPTERLLSQTLNEDLLVDDFLCWPNFEAVVTYRILHKMYGDEKYLALADAIEREAEAYFLAPERNRWYISVKKADGKALQRKEKAGHILGPFHAERVLLALISLEQTGSILQYMQ